MPRHQAKSSVPGHLIVNTAAVFPGPKTKLAVQPTVASMVRRGTHNRLGKPTALGPAFTAPKVKATLAGTYPDLTNRRRRTETKLFPPNLTQPVVTFVAPPVKVTKVVTPPAKARSVGISSKVFDPAVVCYPPTWTVTPSFSGVLTEGQTLTANPGTYSGTGLTSPTYQWQRDNSGGGTFGDIVGATSQTYDLTPTDVGCQIRVLVTLHGTCGNPGFYSSPQGLVVAAVRFGPTTTFAATPDVTTRRAPFYKLQQPTVVAPAVVFPGPKVTTAKVIDRATRRASHWKLFPPNLTQPVAPGQTFPGPKTALASLKPNPAWRKAKKALPVLIPIDPPAAALAEIKPVKVTLASIKAAIQRAQRLAGYSLGGPAVVDDAPPARPVLVFTKTAAGAARNPISRVVKSKLRPPVVVGTAVSTPPFRPIAAYTEVANQAPQATITKRGTYTVLRPPRVIGPAAISRPIKALLAAIKSREVFRRGAKSELRPPIVVDVAGTGPGVICWIPTGTDSLTITAVTPDALTVTTASAASLTVTAVTADSLTITAAGTDTIDFTPVVPEEC